MAITVAGTQNSLATSYSTLATHAAAHTAEPATSGNELTGAGSARGVISWGAAAAGVIVGTATVTVPTAGGTLSSVGLWSALTAGTFRDGQSGVTDIVYPGPGTANITITATVT